MTRSRSPGAVLLHPAALASLALLIVNDHVLKHACPCFLTGKLSDFSGLILFPLFLFASFDFLRTLFHAPPIAAVQANRVLGLCCVVAVIGFALVKVYGPATTLFRVGLGALQWPFAALAALLRSARLPPLRPVSVVRDLTDLSALPMAVVAYWIGRCPAPMLTASAVHPHATTTNSSVPAVVPQTPRV